MRRELPPVYWSCTHEPLFGITPRIDGFRGVLASGVGYLNCHTQMLDYADVCLLYLPRVYVWRMTPAPLWNELRSTLRACIHFIGGRIILLCS